MLFSAREVAADLNDAFEPAWESVRPAPLVTIDFGNGQTVRRTLQGNIATYVCGPDGVVYDVLPGIYTPHVYREQLGALRKLADSIRTEPDADAVAGRLRDYHAKRAAVLALVPPTPPMKAVAGIGGGIKGGIGGGFAGGIAGGSPKVAGGGIEGPLERAIAGQPPTPGGAAVGPLAAHPGLTLDAQVNEQIRRKAVHDRLARSGAVRPDDIKRWLYKDVLHADLDDPQLGLGGVLNDSYPFADEDRAAGGW